MLMCIAASYPALYMHCCVGVKGGKLMVMTTWLIRCRNSCFLSSSSSKSITSCVHTNDSTWIQLLPSRNIWRHISLTWPSPLDTGTPDSLLMPWNCFIDFAFEHWFSCCTNEPVFAGGIGAIEIWLIDWQFLEIYHNLQEDFSKLSSLRHWKGGLHTSFRVSMDKSHWGWT